MIPPFQDQFAARCEISVLEPTWGESYGDHKIGSVFHDLYPEDQATEMAMRAELLNGVQSWLTDSRVTQAEAAKMLGVMHARVSDLRHGKISRFRLGPLVRLAVRAGLRPRLTLAPDRHGPQNRTKV